MILGLCGVIGLLISARTWLSNDRKPAERNAATEEATPYASLRHLLAEVESALKKPLDAASLQSYAARIQNEIKLHPLPDNDGMRFAAELAVRYLRELAPLAAYRKSKIEQFGYDPLDPAGAHPNQQAIASQRKYLASLQARVKDLRAMLTRISKKSEQSPRGH